MNRSLTQALRSGTALAATVAIAYAACSAIFWLWPDTAASFMNALFHGLDFRKLQSGPSPFSFGGFSYALVVIAFWAFLFGTVYGWISRRA